MSDTKLFKKKLVLPSTGDLVLDCGNCGCRTFTAHIRVTANQGRLVELVCKRCLKVFKLDDRAMLEGDGKVTIHGGSVDESNGRPH